jgi:UDP-hydrolysing UDP-N-acetyl-D-glucosamine 2-epimerase
LGELPEAVHLVGCPRIDLVAETLAGAPTSPLDDIFAEGVGGRFDLERPFVLVSQHPVTTEYGDGLHHIRETLAAVSKVGLPAIVLWPNPDAGSEDIASGIRSFREYHDDLEMHFFKNLPSDIYLHLMKRTACLIGNSSSGIREGAFIGTPVVNIGTRQTGRQRGANVIDVDYVSDDIADAVNRQIEHGPYTSEPIYGDGKAGARIAEVLATASWQIQKRITY